MMYLLYRHIKRRRDGYLYYDGDAEPNSADTERRGGR